MVQPFSTVELKELRQDLRIIADLIPNSSRTLDVGCGDGELLAYLTGEKGVDARGIEISQNGVNACVARGLSVIQGDADTDLTEYPDQTFDYAVLSRTLQATRQPEMVLSNLVRISKYALVSFVNYGHWKKRVQTLLHGRIPVNGINVTWYDSPDIHPCTILDFVSMCDTLEINMVSAFSINSKGKRNKIDVNGHGANLSSEQAIFLLSQT